jgi:hypothetical protein
LLDGDQVALGATPLTHRLYATEDALPLFEIMASPVLEDDTLLVTGQSIEVNAEVASPRPVSNAVASEPEVVAEVTPQALPHELDDPSSEAGPVPQDTAMNVAPDPAVEKSVEALVATAVHDAPGPPDEAPTHRATTSLFDGFDLGDALDDAFEDEAVPPGPNAVDGDLSPAAPPTAPLPSVPDTGDTGETWDVLATEVRVSGLHVEDAEDLPLEDGPTEMLEEPAAADGSLGADAPLRSARLEVRSGQERGELVEVEDEVSVGTAFICDLCIMSDKQLSPVHFHVSVRNRSFFLVDNGSSLGTVVNGRKVDEVQLHGGETVMAGRTVFGFVID